jgi:hypothetical protein
MHSPNWVPICMIFSASRVHAILNGRDFVASHDLWI